MCFMRLCWIIDRAIINQLSTDTYHQPTPTTATVLLSAENIKHIGFFNLKTPRVRFLTPGRLLMLAFSSKHCCVFVQARRISGEAVDASCANIKYKPSEPLGYKTPWTRVTKLKQCVRDDLLYQILLQASTKCPTSEANQSTNENKIKTSPQKTSRCAQTWLQRCVREIHRLSKESREIQRSRLSNTNSPNLWSLKITASLRHNQRVRAV